MFRDSFYEQHVLYLQENQSMFWNKSMIYYIKLNIYKSLVINTRTTLFKVHKIVLHVEVWQWLILNINQSIERTETLQLQDQWKDLNTVFNFKNDKIIEITLPAINIIRLFFMENIKAILSNIYREHCNVLT